MERWIFFGALLISPSRRSVVVHLANESPPVIMSRVCVIMNDDKGAELTGCSWGWLYGKRDNHHVVLPNSSRFGSGPRPRSFCRRRTDRERPGIPSITLPEYNREIKIHLNRLRGNYWLSGFAGQQPSNEWPGEQSRAEHCGVNWLTWWTYKRWNYHSDRRPFVSTECPEAPQVVVQWDSKLDCSLICP